MHNYKQVSDIANNLIQAVAAKDSLLMQEHVDGIRVMLLSEWNSGIGFSGSGGTEGRDASYFLLVELVD